MANGSIPHFWRDKTKDITQVHVTPVRVRNLGIRHMPRLHDGIFRPDNKLGLVPIPEVEALVWQEPCLHRISLGSLNKVLAYVRFADALRE